MLKLENFNFITAENMTNAVLMLDSIGTVSILHDLRNDIYIDVLMGQKNFDMVKYCKAHTSDEEAFDTAMIALHDELVDAVTGLNFAMVQCLDEIYMPVDKRRISGIKTAVSSQMSSAFDYSMHYFEAADELEAYLSEHTAAGPVLVRLCLTAGGDDVELDTRILYYTVCGAQDYHVLTEIRDVLLSDDRYKKVTYNVY